MTDSSPRRTITRADILDPAEYERVRPVRRRHLIETKKMRRIAVGPDASLHFESFETVWMQIHEMLRLEKGGAGSVDDELRAYASLVPNGAELVATLMFEIDEPIRRGRVLEALGGIERQFMLQFSGETVVGRPESEVERTNADGKTSSVHFLHFPLTAAQIAAFRLPETRVLAGSDHPGYAHFAVLPDAVRAQLALDLA